MDAASPKLQLLREFMTHQVPALLSEQGALTRHRRPLHALTGVRFFAATYVIFYHSHTQIFLKEHGHPFLGNFVASGYLAVPLFFMLSGFILAYTYRQQIETRDDRIRFLEARFARIWPAYAFSLLLSSVSGLTMPSWAGRVATLSMLQAWNPFHPEYAGLWNAVCWSLSVEALFYLCFPTLQLWLEKCSLRMLEVSGACALAIGVLGNTAIRTLGDPVYPGIFRFIPLPITHLPEFITGVALGNLFLERSLRPGQGGRGWLTWMGLPLTLAMLFTGHGWWNSIVLIGYSLLIYGLATESTWLGRMLSTRVLLLGGAASYSMYLLQSPMRIWTKQALIQVHADNSVTNFVLAYVAILVVATAAYFWLEEPARKFLRSKFAAARQKRLSLAA
jgi:peptidoglycan/LPS O-acetylase OafA/YrhL